MLLTFLNRNNFLATWNRNINLVFDDSLLNRKYSISIFVNKVKLPFIHPFSQQILFECLL